MVAASALLLAGCSSGSDGTAYSQSASVDESVEGAAAPEAGSVDAEDLAASVGGAEVDRSVIVSGSVVLTADDPIAVASLVASAVEGAGGYLDGRTESEGDGTSPSQARLTVRVPPGEVQPMIDSLRGIGKVTDVDLSSSDVTKQVADLETRISAKKVAITRLEELLSGAGSMADLLAVEGELTTRQSELEQLLTEQAGIDDLTSMATLEISVYATDQEPVPDDDEVTGFLGGLSAGWDALVTALGVAVTIVGVVLPWLVLVALVGGVALWVSRRRRTGGARPVTSGPAATGTTAGERTERPVGPTAPARGSAQPTGGATVQTGSAALKAAADTPETGSTAPADGQGTADGRS